MTELIYHLKEHLVEGRPVACPVSGCKNKFSVKSSFTAHMSRKHRDVRDVSGFKRFGGKWNKNRS